MRESYEFDFDAWRALLSQLTERQSKEKMIESAIKEAEKSALAVAKIASAVCTVFEENGFEHDEAFELTMLALGGNQN